jgi:hypothetical protein
MRFPKLALLFLTACGSVSAKGNVNVAVKGEAKMLDATAVAKKCDEAAKGHERPFVIEWDATDLASFEAKASRDTVFVKYTGCNIEVLDRCSDNSIAGRFGTYGQPNWTSGTVQGFDIKTEGELYAKLPLGAVSLSAKVAAGEALHLKYFVSGVAISSREMIYKTDLATYPGCKGATHFVSSYNLGAFELESSQKVSGEAEASAFGAGGGGKAKQESSHLGHGGDLKSCTTNNLNQCRVPIRLVLRKLEDAADAPAVAGGPTPPTAPPPSPGSYSGPTAAEMNEKIATIEGASSAYQSANKKLAAGDGEGCLKDLERVMKLNPTMLDNYGGKYTHARCLMRAGKCEQGTKEIRATLAEQDSKKIKDDAKLDEEARDIANRDCPSSTAKNDADFVIRAAREMHELTMELETGKYKPIDAKSCKSKYDAIFAKVSKMDKKDPETSKARQQGISAMDSGAACVARAGKCADGEPLYVEAYKLKLPGMSGVDKIAKESWATRIKHKDKDKSLATCKE